MADSACRETSTVDFFFPPPSQKKRAAANAVCVSYLVRDECRSWAMDQGDSLDGFWAGTTPGDRQRARKAQPEAGASTASAASDRPAQPEGPGASGG